ncbi:ATP-binding cassette domain-containing protein [Protaetiibacter mangrovi]|uniref:ATP-binding cassette domain-containing protein n=1 Tax=Protaetiibacter mangrovi TaxID=2970926 RepID=A0ABT1ZEB2_9MICO|nr:ATP-binding cassette domain-containing protein [Protaetiibacter mangrovi]MCS0499015.1 ATP-binding cassette domain-containing protein [Protaetiibacter mangrovi]TPW97234.1 ATP-binding cassette domain-containing protein [Schumannella luteola]
MDAITVRGIRKSFGGTEVLRGVELSVAAGTVFALLGPNGAGKTTLINILSTLVAPDAGTATVAGRDVAREPEEVKRRISLTGQSAAVDEVLTGRENLRMMGRLSGLGRRAASRRADELLARFGLDDAGRRRVATYSGGMRRRLDLAISLILTPPVVFLDEPTTGLDTRSRQALWEEIRGLTANGTTVLLTTQYLEEADRLADRIAVIEHGAVVAEGTPEELKARVGGEVVTLSDPEGAVLAELPTDGTLAGLRRAIAAIDHESASVALRSPSLDDVFLAVTGTREPAITKG